METQFPLLCDNNKSPGHTSCWKQRATEVQLQTVTTNCKMEEDHIEMPHLRSLIFCRCSLSTKGSVSVTSLSHCCGSPTSLVSFGLPSESELSLLMITRTV